MLTVKITRGDLSINDREKLSTFLMPQELEIVENIYKTISENKEIETGPVRTHLVLSALAQLGQKFGYEVRGKHSGNSEWLFDCAWLIKRTNSWLPFEPASDNPWATFEGLKLVCESEWHGHTEKILEDFIKLTVAKANIRLFIHSNQYYEYKKPVNTVDICKAVLPLSRGERYLFIGFDDILKSNEFRIDLVQT